MVNINDILDFSYFDFRGLTIVAFYLFLLLYLVKRYIHEKNYPVAYRFFAYFGSFLFFFWPLILLCLVNKEMTDTKGDVYEYLLSKLSTAGTNGQFRTPRHIIRMMVFLKP